MTVYLLYEADAWISKSSMELIAVCSSMRECLRIANDVAPYGCDGPLTDYDCTSLMEMHQTYGRKWNYWICPTELDQLVDD